MPNCRFTDLVSAFLLLRRARTSTTKQFFAAEARVDFYNDIRKGVLVVTDSAYAKMRFLFTTDSSFERIPVGERAYHSLVNSGMEDTGTAFERAMIHGELSAASFVYYR